jgi:hypothetical protein
LEEKYNRYALLNERCCRLQTETKIDLGGGILNFTEERKGRTVEMLRFKLFQSHERKVSVIFF